MVSHGRALDEVYRARPDGDWFCFADTDIKARGLWVDDFVTRLPGCAALTSGALSWTTDDTAPCGATSLAGPYLFDHDGFVFGSSYLAIYRRSAVDSVRRRWDIGFENYGHEELPRHARERIEEFGRAFAVYDTAKVLNILLQADGAEVRHHENPQIVHIGGMATEYLCQAAGVRPADIWLAWVQSLHGPDGARGTTPEAAPHSGATTDPPDLAQFPAVTLQCLVRGEPLPLLPQPLGAETEARLPRSSPSSSTSSSATRDLHSTRRRKPPGLNVSPNRSSSRSATKSTDPTSRAVANACTASLGPGPIPAHTGLPLVIVSSNTT